MSEGVMCVCVCVCGCVGVCVGVWVCGCVGVWVWQNCHVIHYALLEQ